MTARPGSASRPIPVLFHVHGIGRHDFSSMAPDALAEGATVRS